MPFFFNTIIFKRMSSINILYLPEIILSIAGYLNRRDKRECLCVCSMWHEVLLPLLWQDVKVTGGPLRKAEGPTIVGLHEHCELVRTLNIFHDRPGLLSASCPNLHTLRIELNRQAKRYLGPEDPIGLILYNPSLTNLHIGWLGRYLDVDFWTAVSRLPHLKTLRVENASMTERRDAEAFWNACSNVVELHLSSMPGTQRVNEFLCDKILTRMRVLKFDCIGREHMEQLNFICRCPCLENILWRTSYLNEAREEFVQHLAQGTWPNLKSLAFGRIDKDDGTSRLLQAIPQVINIDISDADFGTLSFQALRTHFTTLTRLYLYRCPGASSELLQEIMCSCHHLEELHAGEIRAGGIAKDGPWVCLSLRKLEVYFTFGVGNSDAELQSMVFERLSTLSRLESLDTSDWDKMYDNLNLTALDLRLEAGLGKLAKLKNMRTIDFLGVNRYLEEKEVRWMISNWKQLRSVRGYLGGPSKDVRSLERIFDDHGIVVHVSTK